MLEYTNLSYLAILIISEPSNAWPLLPSRNKITLRGGKTFFFFIGASANSGGGNMNRNDNQLELNACMLAGFSAPACIRGLIVIKTLKNIMYLFFEMF